MARYNEILVGRYNRYLQKLLAMKGEPPAPQLGSEISAAITLFHGVENRYLEGWNRYGIALNVPAVAANGSAWQIRNPVAANVLIVVEKILLSNRNVPPIDSRLSNGAATVDLATSVGVGNSRLDARGISAPSAVLSTQNSVAGVVGTLLNVLMLLETLASTNFEVIITDDQEIPILPGDALRMGSEVVNSQLVSSLVWRERFLEDSERT